jgi:hypothetical protein
MRANGVRSLDVTTTTICGRWPPAFSWCSTGFLRAAPNSKSGGTGSTD